MTRCFRWLTLFSLMIAACGSPSPQQESSTEVAPTATGVPTTFSIWYSDPILTDALTELLVKFEEMVPYIDTTLTLQDAASFQEQVTSAIEAGQGPDMIIGSTRLLLTLSRGGHLMPLDDFRLRDEAASYTINDAFLSGYVGENLYGFPLMLEASLLYVNTALVGEAEIADFDSFVARGSQVGALVQPDFMLTSGWLLPASFPRPLLDAGRLNIADVQLTDYLGRLQTLREVPNISFGQDSSPFANGEVGLYVGSSRELPALRAALGDALRVERVQVEATRPGFNILDVTMMMISINATDANLEAGRLLIPFLVLPEHQSTFSEISGYPPMRAVISDDEFLRRAADIIERGTVIPSDTIFYTDMLPRLNTALAQVVSGVLSPEEASASFFSGE